MTPAILEREYTPTEKKRYHILRRHLAPHAPLFRGRRVLDFGAGHALGMLVLLDLGAGEVVGVEPDAHRVDQGNLILREEGLAERAKLVHVADTRKLPVESGWADFVFCNAVLEHIPQPRDAYLREMWRCLRRGGVLYVHETPNKYLPVDVHTTRLPFLNWLPRRAAYLYARAFRRFVRPDGTVKEYALWPYSGWRGIGHWELLGALSGAYRLREEQTRPRHRLLKRLGLPASLLDPYPLWIVEKG